MNYCKDCLFWGDEMQRKNGGSRMACLNDIVLEKIAAQYYNFDFDPSADFGCNFFTKDNGQGYERD